MAGIAIAVMTAESAKYGFMCGSLYTLGYRLLMGSLPSLLLHPWVYYVEFGIIGMGALAATIFNLAKKFDATVVPVIVCFTVGGFMLSFHAPMTGVNFLRWLVRYIYIL